MPKMQDALSPNAQEVRIWEITPHEHAGLPRRLGGFPPTMEAPLKLEPGTKQIADARHLR